MPLWSRRCVLRLSATPPVLAWAAVAPAHHRAVEYLFLLRRELVVKGEQRGLDRLDAVQPGLHPVFTTIQTVGEARRSLRHLGRQRRALGLLLGTGGVGCLLEGLPGRHLVGLQVEFLLEIGPSANTAGDALLAERLRRELAHHTFRTASRRGRGGWRVCLGDLRRSIEPTVRGGGRGQPGEAGDRHEGSRNSQEKATNTHKMSSLRGPGGQCLSPPSSTGSCLETCPELVSFL